jgi:hypothetical protein
MTQPGYIFIVGSWRTGTSLLRHTLNGSDDVAICDETHFFEKTKTMADLLRVILNSSEKSRTWSETHILKRPTNPGLRQELPEVGDISTDAGAKKIVDYICDTCWRCGLESVDRGEFWRKLLESDRTDRSLFDLIMAFYANGKRIRGEKTPSHIHHVPTLLEWFPNARVIHTFRDPRTITVSRKRNPMTPKARARRDRSPALIFEIHESLGAIILWLRVIQLHYQYQQLFPNNYYFLRSEDLVSAPKTHLKKLCDFLEIDLTETMLQRLLTGRDFGVGIGYWRRHLYPVTNKLVVLLCRKRLLEFGYPLY